MCGAVLVFLYVIGLSVGQFTFEIDGVKNRTLVVSGTVYDAVAPLHVIATDVQMRCGGNVTIRFAGTQRVGVFLIVPPASMAFISETGLFVTLRLLWCASGINTTLERTMAIMPGAAAETRGRIFAGACPGSLLDEGDFSGMQMVVGGTRHACGLHTSGRVFCWGMNDRCQLGVGVAGSMPVKRGVLYPWFSDFVWLTANWDVTCGVRNTSDVVCWGLLAGIPPVNQECSTYAVARYGFAIGAVVALPVAAFSSISVAVTRWSIGVLVSNRNTTRSSFFVTGVSAVLTPTGSDLTSARKLDDYNIATLQAATLWAQYPVFVYTIGTTAAMNVSRMSLSGGDYAFAIRDTVTGAVGVIGDQLGTLCTANTSTPLLLFGTSAVHGCVFLVAARLFGGVYVRGVGATATRMNVTTNGMYATTMRVYGQVTPTAVGFYFNTFYGNQMGVGVNYDSTTGLLFDGLPRDTGIEIVSGVYAIGSVSSGSGISIVSRGTGHACYTTGASAWTCAGMNVYGQLEVGGLAGYTEAVHSNQQWVVAGGFYTCLVRPPNGRVQCIGQYGTGVVPFLDLDNYAGFVDGSVVVTAGAQSAPISTVGSGYELFIHRSRNATWMTATVAGALLQYIAYPGCYRPYVIDCMMDTTPAQLYTPTSASMRYNMQCGQTPVCIEMETCVSPDWRIAGMAMPVTIVSIAAGLDFTCRLLSTGVVECVGMTVVCGYVLPPGGAYDMLEFNAVYTGSIVRVGQLFARGATACYLSVDALTLVCVGKTTAYRWCSAQGVFTARASAGTVFEDVWIGQAVLCYSEVVLPISATSIRRIWCMGNNINGLLGTFFVQTTVTQTDDDTTTDDDPVDIAPNVVHHAHVHQVPQTVQVPYGTVQLRQLQDGIGVVIIPVGRPMLVVYENGINSWLAVIGATCFWQCLGACDVFDFTQLRASVAGALSAQNCTRAYISMYSGLSRDTLYVLNAATNVVGTAANATMYQLPAGASRLSVGLYGTACVALVSGYGVCFGALAYGQGGVPAPDALGVWTIGNGDVLDIVVGEAHVVVLTRANEMLCNGDNTYGQCGHVYTNVTSEGLFVSMDTGLHMWPYVPIMSMDDMLLVPESVLFGTNTSALTTGAIVTTSIVGGGIILLVLLSGCACTWCFYFRRQSYLKTVALKECKGTV